MVLIFSVMFLLGSAFHTVFTIVRNAKEQRSPFLIFKQRVIRSLLILSVVVYLKVNVRILQAIDCVKTADGSLRLQVELSQICYTGTHTAVAALAWILLFLYGFGFPLLCGFIVRKSYLHGIDDEERREKYGFLYRDVKEKYYWYRVVVFASSYFVALVSALGGYYVSLQIFVGAVLFYVFSFFVAAFWPYSNIMLNWSSLVSGFAKAIYIIILLSSLQGASGSNIYLSIFCAVWGISVIVIIVMLVMHMKRGGWLKRQKYRSGLLEASTTLASTLFRKSFSNEDLVLSRSSDSIH